MKVDVVICSKDRPHQLLRCVPMVATLIPYHKVFVFEGSLHPNSKVLQKLVNDFGVEIVKVPDLKFGHVRSLVMEKCGAKYVAMVDDDIVLQKEWFNTLMQEFDDTKVVAVSSKLIFGNGIISKLSWANKRTSGGSGGAAIYDRLAVLEIGNFNKNIHRGEDLELELRIHASGKKWVKSQKTYAQHPYSVKEFLDRPKKNVVGWDFIMKNSGQKTRFMIKQFAGTFIMPVYYFWQTLDIRCAGIWFLYKIKALLYYLSGKYLNWS